MPYKNFYHAISKLATIRQIDLQQMDSDLGITETIKQEWRAGYLPDDEMLKKIAKYLGLSVNELMFRRQEGQ